MSVTGELFFVFWFFFFANGKTPSSREKVVALGKKRVFLSLRLCPPTNSVTVLKANFVICFAWPAEYSVTFSIDLLHGCQWMRQAWIWNAGQPFPVGCHFILFCLSALCSETRPCCDESSGLWRESGVFLQTLDMCFYETNIHLELDAAFVSATEMSMLHFRN